MIVTTTNKIEGYVISEYKGVIFGEVITGVNFIKDFKAGLRDIFGGRSSTYEQELTKAREESLEEIKKRAQALGANAIVGLKMDYEMLGRDSSMMMVTCSGTAVNIVSNN